MVVEVVAMQTRALFLALLALLTIGTPGRAAAVPEAPECGADLERNLDEDPFPFAVLTACPGIRPGAAHSVEGSGCTFNFVFRGTSVDEEGRPVDEGLFIGTAGHCVFDAASGDKVYAPGEGKEVTDSAGNRVGEVAYGVDEGPLDFALIRIDDAREAGVNPAVCHFGGPVGIGTGLARGDLLHHFGNGLVFGDTVQGRTGVFDNYSDQGSVLNWNGAALFGDSGSSVIDADGRAVGVLVRLSPVDTGVVEATDLAFHVARASDFMDMQLELQTAPFE